MTQPVPFGSGHRRQAKTRSYDLGQAAAGRLLTTSAFSSAGPVPDSSQESSVAIGVMMSPAKVLAALPCGRDISNPFAFA